MSWMVLYLRPRCEKKMAAQAKGMGIEHVLPLRREIKVYQCRKVPVDKPVFPGYFFANANQKTRVDLLKTNYVVRMIEPTDEQSLLHELEQIQRALAVDPSLGTCRALKRGVWVRIRQGPFIGIEGQVWGQGKTGRVRLNVDLVGQAVAIEVDREFLEVLD